MKTIKTFLTIIVITILLASCASNKKYSAVKCPEFRSHPIARR